MKYYESYGNRYIEIRPEVLKQIHQQAESEYPKRLLDYEVLRILWE